MQLSLDACKISIMHDYNVDQFHESLLFLIIFIRAGVWTSTVEGMVTGRRDQGQGTCTVLYIVIRNIVFMLNGQI